MRPFNNPAYDLFDFDIFRSDLNESVLFHFPQPHSAASANILELFCGFIWSMGTVYSCV